MEANHTFLGANILIFGANILILGANILILGANLFKLGANLFIFGANLLQIEVNFHNIFYNYQKKISIFFNIYLNKYDKNRILLLVVGIPNGGAFWGDGWVGVHTPGTGVSYNQPV